MNVPACARLRTPRLALALALASIAPAMVVSGCRVEHPEQPDAPAPTPAPTPTPGLATCDDACEGLRRANCREGFPTPGNVTCEDTCRTSSEQRTWPLTCWAGAQTKADVLACGGTRCPPR